MLSILQDPFPGHISLHANTHTHIHRSVQKRGHPHPPPRPPPTHLEMQYPIAGSTEYCRNIPRASRPGCLVNTCLCVEACFCVCLCAHKSKCLASVILSHSYTYIYICITYIEIYIPLDQLLILIVARASLYFQA